MSATVGVFVEKAILGAGVTCVVSRIVAHLRPNCKKPKQASGGRPNRNQQPMMKTHHKLFLFALAAIVFGCAGSHTNGGGAAGPPGPVVSRMVTLSGAKGSSLRVALRARDQAELNQRESQFRSLAAKMDLQNVVTRLVFYTEAGNSIARNGDPSSRAAIEQMAVLSHVLFVEPYGESSATTNVFDLNGKVVAVAMSLPRGGKLTPAYKYRGKVHFVQ